MVEEGQLLSCREGSRFAGGYFQLNALGRVCGGVPPGLQTVDAWGCRASAAGWGTKGVCV